MIRNNLFGVHFIRSLFKIDSICFRSYFQNLILKVWKMGALILILLIWW